MTGTEIFNNIKKSHNLIKCKKGLYLVGLYYRNLYGSISNIMIVSFLDENNNHITDLFGNKDQIKDVYFKEFIIKEDKLYVDRNCKFFKLSDYIKQKKEGELCDLDIPLNWDYFYPKYQKTTIDNIKKMINSDINKIINIVL